MVLDMWTVWKLRVATWVWLWDGLTIIRDQRLISDRTEDGRRAAHYELKWQISGQSTLR